jgi:hypothetical protein
MAAKVKVVPTGFIDNSPGICNSRVATQQS